MRVINLFSGPGAGKSTVAAELFTILKKLNQEVELVTEYAKDLVWDDRQPILKDQLYIMGKQNRRLDRLQRKVDWAITDSPLLLCASYAAPDYYPSFKQLCFEAFNQYDNVNYFLSRSTEYNSIGRMQTEIDAKKVDSEIKSTLLAFKIPFTPINLNTGVHTILEDICKIDETITLHPKYCNLTNWLSTS